MQIATGMCIHCVLLPSSQAAIGHLHKVPFPSLVIRDAKELVSLVVASCSSLVVLEQHWSDCRFVERRTRCSGLPC